MHEPVPFNLTSMNLTQYVLFAPELKSVFHPALRPGEVHWSWLPANSIDEWLKVLAPQLLFCDEPVPLSVVAGLHSTFPCRSYPLDIA